MNARQVATMIASTCQDLRSLGLVTFDNSPCQRREGAFQRVAWPSVGPSAARTFAFGSLGQYLSLIKEGAFTCLLKDYSVVQASYDCDGTNVVAHSLLYWPAPVAIQEPVEDLGDLCAAVAMCMESPASAAPLCELYLRSPMRFDFDPDRASEDHPEVHLHTQFDDTRIHVDRPMSFTTFVKMVFKTFYRETWNSCPELARMHEQRVPLVKDEFAPVPHSLCLAWSAGRDD
ncbi:MAG: DUF2290 domain-containing protein [Phycisphaeraceae bacterium]|nr:MAG: DUF2290 domain-containing protein [Phycisphaeraceae bacterium]